MTTTLILIESRAAEQEEIERSQSRRFSRLGSIDVAKFYGGRGFAAAHSGKPAAFRPALFIPEAMPPVLENWRRGLLSF